MLTAPNCYGYAAKKTSTSFKVQITKVMRDVILYKRTKGRKVTDCALPRCHCFDEQSKEWGEYFGIELGKTFDKLGVELVAM